MLIRVYGRAKVKLNGGMFKKGNLPWNKKLISRKILKKLYINNKLSSLQCGDVLGCSSSAILRRLKEYNISIRNPKEAKKDISDKTRKKISLSHADVSGENNPNWKNGISFEEYPIEFNEELKELIRFRDGYKCQKCGCPEIENNRKLNVHHIDYNKKNCLPSNLVSLCRRCNAEVNFKRNKWEKCFYKKIEKIMDSNSMQLHFRFQKKKTWPIKKGVTIERYKSGKLVHV